MSTLQAEEQIEARELIDRFREAQRARAAARRATSLLILGAVAVYGTLIWATFLDFRNNRLPQLSQALATVNAQIETLRDKPTEQMDRSERLQRRLIVAWLRVIEEAIRQRQFAPRA